MKKLYKGLVYAVLIALCIFLTVSCKKNPNKPGGPGSDTYGKENNPDGGLTDPDDGDNIPDAVITGTDYKLVMVNFYTVNPETKTVRRASVMELDTTEITPERVMDYLIDSLEDESITLGLDSIQYENGCCIVSFSDTIYMLAGKSGELEDAVLDAAAQSILDNVKGCKSVIFRINGEAYNTANNSFGINDIYMDN